MFQHVLVPLDGSSQADKILPFVVWLAKGFHLPLTLLSVADVTSGAPPGPMPEEGARQLHALVSRLIQEGVQAAPAVAVGKPAQEIIRIAEDRGCDLIILSTSTGQSKSRGTLGRVADKVFHTSHIPVLLIPPQPEATPTAQESPFSALILPLDGSPQAESALPYAEDLSQRLALPMVVVRAVPFPGAYVDEKTPPAGEVEANTYLQSVVDRLQAEGVIVEAKVFGGLPVPHILELAHQMPQSLVVLTTHGRSALTRWFVGSVAEGVVRAAEVPVLVIPHQFSRRYALRVAELLSHSSLFAELHQEDLEQLAETARIRTYHPGEVIVREGETATGCFMLASGRVEVLKGVDSQHPTTLATLGAGDLFGEMAVIDDHPRSATVRALEETECVAIRREDFLETLQQRPQIAVRMLPVLVRRLRQADARAVE
ncbi:MAG TPA: universal stress protein [Alphaproteobacteria bacterium]|nr:universal stress protein [Alphaproteobacteria bacterium]